MKTEYDVLIVGAGVVGIYLSKCLEKRGLKVLLIDKGGGRRRGVQCCAYFTLFRTGK